MVYAEEVSVLLFMIKSFCKFVSEGKLMVAKCEKCVEVMLPLRPACL